MNCKPDTTRVSIAIAYIRCGHFRFNYGFVLGSVRSVYMGLRKI